MADISDEIKKLRGDVEGLSAEEKLVRGRISELKQLIMEKQKRSESLAAAKAEEAELLKQLSS